jgi:hypothetical protein
MVPQETLRMWHRRGSLVHNDDLRYEVSALDDVLKTGARNFKQPPTWDDLLHGRITLVTKAQAQELLPVSNYQLRARMQSGDLAAVKLIATWRYDKASLMACFAAERSNDRLIRQVAGHILGISDCGIARLVASGRLEAAEHITGEGQVRAVTHASLARLLSELLPAWIDPQDWIDDRLDSSRPLLRPLQAAQLLGVRLEELNRIAAEQRLAHINRPSGRCRLYSPESAWAYLEPGEPLSFDQIGNQFGASSSGARGWWVAGALTCPLPLHLHTSAGELYKACLIAILENCLSPGIPAKSWYNYRSTSTERLIAKPTVMKRLGVTERSIDKLIQQAVLKGILRPDGGWRFTPRQIRRCRKRMKAAIAGPV